MSQTFNCPSCGAPLNYDGGYGPIVRCAYCNSTVVVPEGLRSRASKPQKPVWSVASGPTSPPIDLGVLRNLKTIKKLACEGKEKEAAQLYRETFGVSTQEATEAVTKLALGQSIVLSHTTFTTPLSIISGTQVQMGSKITYNGREYANIDDMPTNVRQTYERAIQQVSTVLADTDHNGIPDVLEITPAKTTLEESKNRAKIFAGIVILISIIVLLIGLVALIAFRGV